MTWMGLFKMYWRKFLSILLYNNWCEMKLAIQAISAYG